MEKLVNEIISTLDILYKNGELNDYFISDNDRKWVNLINDILVVKFGFPFGGDTRDLANEIFNEYIITWKGQQKFKNILNVESEQKLDSIIKETIDKVLEKSYFTKKQKNIY